MKKELIIVNCWLVLSSFVSGFIRPVFAQSEFGIYADPGFSSLRNRFKVGETAYIKAEIEFFATKTNQVRLLTADSRQVGEALTFSQSGTDPYLYTASLTLPSESGLYIFDVRLESDSSSYSVTQTVTVGSGRTRVVWPTPLPTPTLAEAKTETPETLFSRMIEVIREVIFLPGRFLTFLFKRFET